MQPIRRSSFSSCIIQTLLQSAFIYWMLVAGPIDGVSSFSYIVSPVKLGERSSWSLFSSREAQDLLYQDQQNAMLRRALEEKDLIEGNGKKKMRELKAPKLSGKVDSGTGFASGAIKDPNMRLGGEQAKIVRRDGVVRINKALSPDLADALLEYVLEQKEIAQSTTETDPRLSQSFYGVEQSRKHRCDLQLSLLRGGYAVDANVDQSDISGSHILADVLQGLLGKEGTLKHVYEELVTKAGEFYELAAVITEPGSNRQVFHPDLPFQADAPLYVIFLALQDVTEAMGPTSFLLRTHTAKENARFNNPTDKDEQLVTADCRLSTLKKGDAVLFDARVLHCGNGNDSDTTRALFNFSFRNPIVAGDLGYAGSMRPGYCHAMTLGDVGDALMAHENGNTEPFAQYGSGLVL